MDNLETQAILGENRCRWKEKFEDTKGVIRICKYTREILKG
jgi:hypothetical protein